VVRDASRVAQQYLTGLGLMIATLWVLYGIAFSIIGVKFALFFAVLCGILEIVPYVGNITGTALTVGMVLTQGGSASMVVAVLATYLAIQLTQSNLLEPLIVGHEVNLNPAATIIGFVAGELVWGVPGMVLAVPLLAIAKIICDHVEPLKPYGFLLGPTGKRKKRDGAVDRIKKWFQTLKK
jgi:predicted PurR-regulated permease PerM